MDNTPCSVKLDSLAYNYNTVFKAFDFNPENGLVACAVANLIGIQDYTKDEKNPQALFTLKGHTGRVNAVRWLGKSTVVSVSEDQSIVINKVSGDPRVAENWSVS
jgi:hypothetical protein